MRVIDERTVRLAVEIRQFVADYWHDVDENEGGDAPNFYTEDCVMSVGSDRIFEGRAVVADFYRYRAERGVGVVFQLGDQRADTGASQGSAAR